jgi:hypothetical protein
MTSVANKAKPLPMVVAIEIATELPVGTTLAEADAKAKAIKTAITSAVKDGKMTGHVTVGRQKFGL